ncbi:phage baseplate protein [Acinetobacter indicus]|uniref:phage baseplate protein n=1 Tax=Acinetobacter indicus TaxID=756892 RepID=UPI0032B5A49C
MQRIDSINARPNINGTGKKGFHDNTDLPGQDATYLTPTFLNAVQEELANVIEGFGRTLNPNQNDQLLQVLSTLNQTIANVSDDIRDNLESRLILLENKKVQEIGVGDLYITTLNFQTSEEVAAHKGYGRWVKFGDGQVLMTQAEAGSAAPNWAKNLQSTGGAYEHKLTIAELPGHKHSQNDINNKFVAMAADAYALGKRAVSINGADDNDFHDELQVNSIDAIQRSQMTELSVGGGQPHNNIQPSIVIAAWKRLPDIGTYALSCNTNITGEGANLTFTLRTTELPAGTAINWRISGIQSADISPNALAGLFILDFNGEASYTLTVVNDNKTEGVETLRMTLSDYPTNYVDVVINDTSTTISTAIVVNNAYLDLTDVESNYYIKPTINLYDLFVAQKGRTPIQNEVVDFVVDYDVAVVADSVETAAIVVGTNWHTSNVLNLINNGMILGRGGSGAAPTAAVGATAVGNNGLSGGMAIRGGNVVLNVTNVGTIAGGGGGGASATWTAESEAAYGGAGGGGAPFGVGGNANAGTASLLSGGIGEMLSSQAASGGNIGLRGDNTSTSDKVAYGGMAGYAYIGNININPASTGSIIGSSL